MSDLQDLIAKLKAESPEFADGYERGSDAFRIGMHLQLAREDAGMTQEQVAERMGTKKSAISRIENNAGDLRLSTLQRYAEAVGRRLILELGGPEDTAKPVKAPKPRKSRKLVGTDAAS